VSGVYTRYYPGTTLDEKLMSLSEVDPIVISEVLNDLNTVVSKGKQPK
jgi:hypothetical protein